MRHHEILWDIMRQHNTLRDIMDEMGLYKTASETSSIGDHMRHYETV